MHVFHIRGFSGILMLMAAAISAVLLLALLPASFLMVLWNALVYEGFKGPEISIYQGFMLWGFVMIMLKVIFNPEIKFQVQKGKQDKKGKTGIAPMTDASAADAPEPDSEDASKAEAKHPVETK